MGTGVVAETETFIGMSSLAAVSLGGMLGGGSLSLIMSVINIGTAILVGRYAPRLYEPRINGLPKRLAGAALVVAALLLVLTVNLMFGNVRHYGLESFSTSLAFFWQGRILPQSLESFGLVAFGVLIFCGAYFKFSRLHDSVGDYEQAHRRVANLEGQLATLNDRMRAELQLVVGKVDDRLNESSDEAKGACVACRHLLKETESAFKTYSFGRERIIKVHEQCAEKRRSALKHTCERVPDYWKESGIDFSAILSGAWDLSPAQAQLARVEVAAETLLATISKARSKLEMSYRSILGHFDDPDAEDHPAIGMAAE